MTRYEYSILVFLCLTFPIAAHAVENESSFELHVRPILRAHCFECHGEGKKLEGGLDLRLARFIHRGGESGAAAVAGKPEESLLVQRIAAEEMPPSKTKLSANDRRIIESWVRAGAKAASPEPETIAPGLYIGPESRSFWSFQPIRRPPPPQVREPKLVRTPIDAFLLEKLESKSLSFSPEADRRTLIRRASFDLLGLPPKPEEIEQFLSDAASDAYERLVDRLLSSPHYGERWGRHWLDVAGYADSDGYTAEDAVRPFAWLYRDYVIRSFNADLPFDRFIHEQLAGDELVRRPYEQLRNEELDKLIATGFLRLAPDGTASSDVEQPVARNQVIADTLQIVGTSLLGVTVHCAQCHNHRYDPISQTDYYAMRAIFEPGLDWKNWRPKQARAVVIFDDADRQRAAELDAEAKRLEEKGRMLELAEVEKIFERELAQAPENLQEELRQARATSPRQRTTRQQQVLRMYPGLDGIRLRKVDPAAAAEVQKYFDQATKLKAARPQALVAPVMTEVPGRVPATVLFHRGDHAQPGAAVAPAGLTILASCGLPPILPDDSAVETTGRRLAFARQLTSPSHPLTSRVLVNRIWMHHFGRGIVSTPADFGFLGERPTHPELLDWLADEFMASGWRLKRLHRLIMTSTAYRQQSTRTAALDELDPDNVFLARMSLRRLEAEALRDSVLSVSGQLNTKKFGPPAPVTPDPSGQVVIGVDPRDDVGRFRGPILPLGGEENRRSIYIQVRRSLPLGVIAAFDPPITEPNCTGRTLSTVAPQSLLLMNSDFIDENARLLAARVKSEFAETEARVTRAWELALGAEPTLQDIADAAEFIDRQSEAFRSAGEANPADLALASFCQALLSSNRFLYID